MITPRIAPLSLLLGIGILGVSAAVPVFGALAPPAFKITDNLGDLITVDATGAITYGGNCTHVTCSLSSTVMPGSIVLSGTVGPFTIQNLVGHTKPFLNPPQIDAGTTAVSTVVGGVLTITYSDVGFTGSGLVALLNETTSAIDGNVTASYTGYIDNSDALFGETTEIGNITTSMVGNQLFEGTGPSTQPFSFTLAESFNMGPASFVANDFALQAEMPPPKLTLA